MLNVFISYSHKDPELLQELRVHLAPLRRQRLINDWSDVAILPGERWEDAIWENFRKSDLVLLLISPDFLYSDYCYDREFQAAMARSADGIIPIIVRACDWQNTPLKDLQAVPAVPVTSQPNRDEAWDAVVKKVHQKVRSLSSRGSPQAGRHDEDFEGDASAWLCDRQDQEAELWMRFLGRTGVPQIYFLPGAEDAQHRRFLDRVMYRTLPDMVGQPRESLRDLVKFVPARWLEKPPSGNEFPYLRAVLARDIDPALEQDAAKIKAHPKLNGRIVVIQHRVFARHWNDRMPGLLRQYAEFWAKAADDRDRPLFLIFFSLIYGQDQLAQADAIEAQLATLSAELDGNPCTAALLPRLGCIEREHVMNWMEQYAPRRKRSHGEALLARLFAGGNCLTMSQVEDALVDFIE